MEGEGKCYLASVSSLPASFLSLMHAHKKQGQGDQSPIMLAHGCELKIEKEKGKHCSQLAPTNKIYEAAMLGHRACMQGNMESGPVVGLALCVDAVDAGERRLSKVLLPL